MIDEKIRKIFDNLCKANDEIITTKDSVIPVLFLIDKDYRVTLNAFHIEKDNKEVMKQFLLKTIAQQEIKGYIFISDTWATNMKTKEVMSMCLRILYTPQDKIMSCVTHDGKTIKKTEEIKGRTNQEDTWDLWNKTSGKLAKDEKEYNKFREEHPELYGGEK